MNNNNNNKVPPFAAAPRRSKRKHDDDDDDDDNNFDAEAANSESDDFLPKPETKKAGRGKVINIETFEAFLRKGYKKKDSDEVQQSGPDKYGHTLYFKEGLIFCRACNKQLAYKRVTQHIVGKNHRDKVANHLRRHQESLVNGDSSEGDDDSVADDDTAMQAEMSLQDEAHAAKKQSASSRPKKAEKTAEAEAAGAKNSLPIMQDGLLVVNGVDVGKYIRGLEERISELEKKP